MQMTGMVALACTCSGLIGFGSAVWGAVRWVHRSTVKAIVGEIAARTAPLQTQLTHNGGSSMRDDITAIRETQAKQDIAITAHGQQLRSVVEAMHAVNGRLDAMQTTITKGGS